MLTLIKKKKKITTQSKRRFLFRDIFVFLLYTHEEKKKEIFVYTIKKRKKHKKHYYLQFYLQCLGLRSIEPSDERTTFGCPTGELRTLPPRSGEEKLLAVINVAPPPLFNSGD
jgi:hypothetical protein